MTVVLVGNPNAGKSRLFNRLTGARAEVGNRPGVTIDRMHARFRTEDTLVDLPGIYSLSPESADEARAVSYIRDGAYDMIYNVVDATCIKRSLALTQELLHLARPMLVVVTMTDEARKRGITVDHAALSRRLGVPVFAVSAKTGEGIDMLLSGKSVYAHTDITRPVVTEDEDVGTPLSDRIDAVLTHRVFGLPFFAAIMALVFFFVFGAPGKALSTVFDLCVLQPIRNAVFYLCEHFSVTDRLSELLLDGILGGVSSVLLFLPQILLLYLFLAVLEDSGYMARVAMLCHPLTARIGMDGRAAVAFLLGIGCTVPAILSTDTLTDPSERRRATLILPFVSCGARATVYGIVTAVLFPRSGWLVGFFLYALGLFVAFLTAKLLLRAEKPKKRMLCIEFPPYRMPSLSSVTQSLGRRTRAFLAKAGSVVFLSSLCLYLLSAYGATDGGIAFVSDAKNSFLYRMGEYLSPLFAPIGLSSPVAVAALLSGIAGKETVVVALGILVGKGSIPIAVLSPTSALPFLVFLSLAFPCTATLSVMRRRVGRRGVFVYAAYSTAVAYFMSLLVYRVALLFA